MSAMLDTTYKSRCSEEQLRQWTAAATLHGKGLSEWIRDSLDEQAEEDLLNYSRRK
jgi:hypothetical protein